MIFIMNSKHLRRDNTLQQYIHELMPHSDSRSPNRPTVTHCEHLRKQISSKTSIDVDCNCYQGFGVEVLRNT